MVHEPKNLEALRALLADCQARGVPVTPRGGGTHVGYGAVAPADAETLSLAAFQGTVFHEPDDMVAAFLPGTPLATVQAVVGAHRQRLDLDPALPASTLGGAVAIDYFGPRCQGWGSLRDRLLGLSFMLPDGKVIKAGGKVMKNVAGYDPTRLMVGAMGTLGILTEIIVRLNPLPDTQGAWVFGYATLGEAWEAAQRVRRGMLEPHVLVVAESALLAPALPSTPDAPWLLLVGAEGVAEFVQCHADRLNEALGAPLQTLDPAACEALWAAWPAFLTASPKAPIVARFGARPAHLEKLLKVLAERQGVLLYPSRGVGYCHLPHAAALEAWRADTLLVNGYTIAQDRLPDLTADQVWGPPRPDLTLMRKLKVLHDPRGILNRGRYYGGL
jgi:glycolate oxidase FAD binding subunit